MSMFDRTILQKVLYETTIQLRPDDQGTTSTTAVGPVDVVEINLNPTVSQARDDLELVDLVLLTVGVGKKEAEANRDIFIKLLDSYPEPDRLAGGPSYIELGGVIGDQGQAFQFMALGKVLGLWGIASPLDFGMDRAQATELAGSGFVMITGYHLDGASHPSNPDAGSE